MFGLRSVDDAHPGTVTFIQRFDSALRLNVHFHTLALDGVYVLNADGAPVFHPLPEPTPDEIADVAARTAAKVARLLERAGRYLDDTDNPLADEQALASCYNAAASGMSLFGSRAGRPTLRLVRRQDARGGEPVAQVMGFNVHAGVAFDGRDRKRLERLCRYLARPPIAQDRLERLDDGRLCYTMKKSWRDGTHAVVFEPLDLIARLCAMVPPPRAHMVRFHGVLSSHAKLRARVVPAPPKAPPPPDGQLELDLLADSEPPRRRPWAWLLRYVFEHEVTVCPRCQGPMRWLEVATTPDHIARVLARHGLTDTSPARASPPPQLSLPFPRS